MCFKKCLIRTCVQRERETERQREREYFVVNYFYYKSRLYMSSIIRHKMWEFIYQSPTHRYRAHLMSRWVILRHNLSFVMNSLINNVTMAKKLQGACYRKARITDFFFIYMYFKTMRTGEKMVSCKTNKRRRKNSLPCYQFLIYSECTDITCHLIYVLKNVWKKCHILSKLT